MYVQLLLQFKCTETCHCLQIIQMSLLTDHSDAQVVYIQYSVTLISITFFSCDHRLLPMSRDIDCWYVHVFQYDSQFFVTILCFALQHKSDACIVNIL